MCYFDCKYWRTQQKTAMKTKTHPSFHHFCRDTASLRLPIPPWFANLGSELMHTHGASLPGIYKKNSGKNCSKTKVSKTPNAIKMVWKNYQVCPPSCFCFIFRIFQAVACRKELSSPLCLFLHSSTKRLWESPASTSIKCNSQKTDSPCHKQEIHRVFSLVTRAALRQW